MDEYVSKEAFIKRFKGTNVSWVMTMLDIFREFPAADVVKVVRCKNCEHCSWYTETNHLMETQKTKYWCNQGPGRPREVKPDGFCSDGEERKDD